MTSNYALQLTKRPHRRTDFLDWVWRFATERGRYLDRAMRVPVEVYS
jgi:hypothetical protein